ncbi:hypothetical protein M0802_011833 [Mischocyttarus mexicanus]|nr:hypothetical protein M0802_011833 [Mischocyttarus mexicanus]
MTSIRANGTNQADWPSGIYISAGEGRLRLPPGDSERMLKPSIDVNAPWCTRCRTNPERCEGFEADEMQKSTSSNITDAYAFPPPDIAQQKVIELSSKLMTIFFISILLAGRCLNYKRRYLQVGELKYTREWPKGSRSVKVVPVTPSEIQFGTAGCVVVQLLRRSMQIAKVEHKHTYILKGKTSGKSRVSFGMGAWLRDTNVLPN